MKIAQISYSGFGGLGSVVFSIIGADSEKRHSWSVGFIGDQPLDASYAMRAEQQDVTYEVFRSIPGRPYGAWLCLKRWLDEIRPDAVICHSINSVLACRWHTFGRGVPLLVVEHTPNQVKTRNEWLASRVSMVVADKVVTLTPEYRDELRAAHGWLYRADKIHVIPNGIDTAEFTPALTNSAGGTRPIRLGMAARFSFSKRQDLLVSMVDHLARLKPDLNFEIAFAGDGPELSRVQSLAAQSSAADRIRFDGLLAEKDVAEWLRRLDVYVHATDGETLSTSLLQAMATGLPIVASDIPGVRNLLQGINFFGDCVENTSAAFATAVCRLVDDPRLAVELGRRARARIVEKYSNRAMLDAYLGAIDDARR